MLEEGASSSVTEEEASVCSSDMLFLEVMWFGWALDANPKLMMASVGLAACKTCIVPWKERITSLRVTGVQCKKHSKVNYYVTVNSVYKFSGSLFLLNEI